MKKIRNFATDLLFYILGSAVYSVGVLCFASPNNIAPGGATGIATVLNYLFSLPIGMTVLAINIPLILLAWKFLGIKFIEKTAVATVVMSVMLDVLKPFLPHYNGDRLLAAVFGGICAGAGLAIFFLRNATSGGTDILAFLLLKKYPNISTGRIVFIIDMAIVVLSGVAYKNAESSLYALIYIFISTQLIDKLMYGQMNAKALTIITNKPDEVVKVITTEFSRGATVIDAKGGYTNEKKTIIYCVVRKNQTVEVTRRVKKCDDAAFIIISQADQVIGDFAKK